MNRKDHWSGRGLLVQFFVFWMDNRSDFFNIFSLNGNVLGWHNVKANC